MTLQVSETIQYDEQTYEIKGFSDVEPFHSLGIEFNPIAASSACWRGYSCEYAVKDYRLYLEHLFVNHSDGNKTPSKEPPPPVNAVQATTSDCPEIGKWQYSNINLFLENYSGGILVAKGLKRDWGQAMNRHLWDYETVYELLFTNGVLLDSYNMNKITAEFKQRKNDRPVGKRYEEILQWERDNKEWFWNCFKKDYFS